MLFFWQKRIPIIKNQRIRQRVIIVNIHLFRMKNSLLRPKPLPYPEGYQPPNNKNTCK